MGRVRTSHKEGLLSKIGKRVGLISLIGIPALLQAYTISGTIFDFEDKSPNQGDKVEICDYENNSNKDSTLTNESGFYEIEFSGSGIEEEDKRKNIEVINNYTSLDLLVDKEINGDVYDALGRRIKGFNGNNKINISVNDLRSGNHFVVIPDYKSFKFTVADGTILGLGKETIDEKIEEENTNFLIKKPNSMKGSMDSLMISVIDPDSTHYKSFFYRAINSDTIIDRGLIPKDEGRFNLNHVEYLTWRQSTGGLQRFLTFEEAKKENPNKPDDSLRFHLYIDTTNMGQASYSGNSLDSLYSGLLTQR